MIDLPLDFELVKNGGGIRCASCGVRGSVHNWCSQYQIRPQSCTSDSQCLWEDPPPCFAHPAYVPAAIEPLIHKSTTPTTTTT